MVQQAKEAGAQFIISPDMDPAVIRATREAGMVSPHAAALSLETNYNGSLICARSIIRVYHGEAPIYPVK